MKYVTLGLTVVFLVLLAGAGGPAVAQEGIVVVQWGGPYIEVSRTIGAEFTKQTGIPISWELHAGGSAAILSKIKAAWPTVKYDAVAAWDPVFFVMMREGWTVPLRAEDVTVLSEISDVANMRDPNTKEIHTLGMSRAFIGWGYRADKLKNPLTSVKQLFSPELKNRICVSDAVANTGLQLVTFALSRGGNEFNVEPGFEFAKDLAKSGNVRTVVKTEAEAASTLLRGDCWVSFWNVAAFFTASKEVPIKAALKLSDTKTFLYHEGFAVLSGPRAAAAKKFVNFFLQAKNNEAYNQTLGYLPTNRGAKAANLAAQFSLRDEEIKDFGYLPDYDHIIKSLDSWNKRWETEVLPLLKR